VGAVLAMLGAGDMFGDASPDDVAESRSCRRSRHPRRPAGFWNGSCSPSLIARA
jgi:hypothetical protein